MNINIFGSTGIIGSKTLDILKKKFPKIKINLLCANNNVNKLIKQAKLYSPDFIYINNTNKYLELKKKIPKNIKILNTNELKSYLKTSKVEYSILSVSGYSSLTYLESILKNSKSVGIVSKEAIVSAGHLFKNFTTEIKNKIYPLDSEHFSIYKFLNNNHLKFDYLTLTASGGPFLGKKFSSLKNVTYEQAIKHPRWKMGYKNSIDSATLSNKCLELIEAHYLFNIPFDKLDVVIHPESKIHSIFEYKNYIYNMIVFHNDMFIPIYHFLNQKYNYRIKEKTYSFKKNNQLNFKDVKLSEFPVYKLFKELDKTNPSNIIKFNVANEYAVDSFRYGKILYTDIYKIIDKFTSLNFDYKLNNIKDIINYHEFLEIKINENH